MCTRKQQSKWGDICSGRLINNAHTGPNLIIFGEKGTCEIEHGRLNNKKAVILFDWNTTITRIFHFKRNANSLVFDLPISFYAVSISHTHTHLCSVCTAAHVAVFKKLPIIIKIKTELIRWIADTLRHTFSHDTRPSHSKCVWWAPLIRPMVLVEAVPEKAHKSKINLQ